MLLPAARALAVRALGATGAAAAARQTAAASTRRSLLLSSSASAAASTLPFNSNNNNPTAMALRWASSDAAAATQQQDGRNNNGNSDGNNDGGDGGCGAALYLTSPEGGARGATPLLLGLMNYLERHLPDVGYFLPVGSPAADRDPLTGLDRRAALVAAASDHRALGDPREMVAVPEEEAALLIASGRTSELLDRIYAAFAAVRDRHDMVVVEGTGVGGSEFEAQVAAALGTPVLLALNARNHHHHHHQNQPHAALGGSSSGGGGDAASSSSASSAARGDRLAAGELFSAAMVKRQLFADHGVPLLGVAVNRAPASDHALIAQQLRRRFGAAGLTFAGAIPEDPVLSGVRLGEVQARLGAGLLCGGGGGGGGPGAAGAAALAAAGGTGTSSSGPGSGALLLPDELYLDREFNSVVVASQRLEELLEALEAMPPGKRPLVVTTVDRLDLVLGLLAAHVSVASPPIAGIMLCPTAGGFGGLDGGGGGLDAFGGGGGAFGVGGAAMMTMMGDGGVGASFGETPHHPRSPHSFARRTVQRVFEGVARGGMYRGALLPVLAVGAPIFDVVRALGDMGGQIMPTSARKIGQCRNLFDRYIDANALVVQLERLNASSAAARRVTPKMFQHSITAACLRDPQRIVLPEGTDARVLAAAADATARGLAKITLLGDPAAVRAEAAKLGLDVSRCDIVDPATSDRAVEYAELYAAIRAERRGGAAGAGAGAGAGGSGASTAKPGRPPPTREASLEAVRSDVNLFGVMMVRAGAADGMVSGAAHTTAATVRPAMQVLRKSSPAVEPVGAGSSSTSAAAPPPPPSVASSLISSVFFMCLPDRVVVYGDCAVNVSPTAEELAAIAVASADTASAFGIEPRVAMLSYSTLGSGSGPEVERVAKAVALVKAWRPDLAVEGPIQYDAAIDPAVAKLKIKGASEVAGKATVFVFPDLNTGNNTYKAVQQSSASCVAMGPVLQNLSKPVNDLSRGATVADIRSTIAITSVQAQQARQAMVLRQQQGRGAGSEAASAA